MTDWELLQRFVQTRSEEAFAELVLRHSGWIRSAARRQVRSAHLADDVTQAVLLALAQQAHRLHQASALSSWLFQVTRFASAAALRNECRRKRHEHEVAKMTQQYQSHQSADSTMTDAMWNELVPALDACVARLRNDDQRAVLLRFYQQMSYPDIAMALGVSEEAARKRTDRAVDKLRQMFGKRGNAIPAVALSAGLWTRTSDAAPIAFSSCQASADVLAITNGALHMMKLATFTTPVATGLAALIMFAATVTLLRADSPAPRVPAPLSAASNAAVSPAPADPAPPAPAHADPLITGADQTDKYLPLLKDKRVGMVVNPTSIIGDKPSVDVLLASGVRITKIFGPEHGFRGNASNGTPVADEIDPKTRIPIISLYGDKRKPSAKDMSDLDILIYDIQDMGVRYYTNINTLRDVMDACAQHDVELLLLDRPNPHAYMIDGPLLEMNLKSGIGQFPVPIAHGMTVGEFAQMINGQGWLENPAKKTCKLTVIPVANYTHDTPYVLPVNPSPNLNSAQAVMLYPSLCLFEGTILNCGRGTKFPFTVLGAPALKGKYEFSYTPVSIPGMAEDPLYQDEVCYGLDLRNYDVEQLRRARQINLTWIKELYAAYPDKEMFFNQGFHRQIGSIDKLSGTTKFKQQIIDGVSEADIRKTWEPDLKWFKTIRQKYLLYP